jgi:hypothetical protein
VAARRRSGARRVRDPGGRLHPGERPVHRRAHLRRGRRRRGARHAAPTVRRAVLPAPDRVVRRERAGDPVVRAHGLVLRAGLSASLGEHCAGCGDRGARRAPGAPDRGPRPRGGRGCRPRVRPVRAAAGRPGDDRDPGDAVDRGRLARADRGADRIVGADPPRTRRRAPVRPGPGHQGHDSGLHDRAAAARRLVAPPEEWGNSAVGDRAAGAPGLPGALPRLPRRGRRERTAARLVRRQGRRRAPADRGGPGDRVQRGHRRGSHGSAHPDAHPLRHELRAVGAGPVRGPRRRVLGRARPPPGRAGRDHYGHARHLQRRRRRSGGAVRLLRGRHLRARARRAVGRPDRPPPGVASPGRRRRRRVHPPDRRSRHLRPRDPRRRLPAGPGLPDNAAGGHPRRPHRRHGRVRVAAAPGLGRMAVAAVVADQRRAVRADPQPPARPGLRVRRARSAGLAGAARHTRVHHDRPVGRRHRRLAARPRALDAAIAAGQTLPPVTAGYP